MTTTPAPSAPSTHTTPSVTFKIAADEFDLLANLMAPMHFNESQGESIWVTSNHGLRQWLVTAHGVTSVVFSRQNELGRCDIDNDAPWAFPIPEHVLITMSKFAFSSVDMSVTLSDKFVTLVSDTYSMKVSQNPLATEPPIVPTTASIFSIAVEPAGLWTMLSSARMWPTGGNAMGMNTPMRCVFDFDRQQLVFEADWTAVDAGVHEYRMPAQFSTCPPGATIKPFNIAHGSILQVIGDPMSAEKLGRTTIHAPLDGEKFMKLSGENWTMYVPALPDIRPWGHDLGEVTGDVPYTWTDCSRVNLYFPELDKGIIELSALPNEPRFGNYKYRASYEILDDVIASIDLYNELNSFNEGTGGYRIVIEGHRLLAICDLTQDNYQRLESHSQAFARQIEGLGPIMSAITASI